MIRTIPVDQFVPTARTAAPAPNTSEITSAALLSKSRTSGPAMRTPASG
jgi:hypothetical protein